LTGSWGEAKAVPDRRIAVKDLSQKPNLDFTPKRKERGESLLKVIWRRQTLWTNKKKGQTFLTQ